MTQPANRLLPATVGDTGDTRTIRVDGIDNMTDVTAVRGHVWRDGVAAVVLTAAVASVPNRTVSVQLGTWLAATATAGDWQFELELDTAVSSLTWPTSPAVLSVRAQGN